MRPVQIAVVCSGFWIRRSSRNSTVFISSRSRTAPSAPKLKRWRPSSTGLSRAMLCRAIPSRACSRHCLSGKNSARRQLAVASPCRTRDQPTSTARSGRWPLLRREWNSAPRTADPRGAFVSCFLLSTNRASICGCLNRSAAGCGQGLEARENTQRNGKCFFVGIASVRRSLGHCPLTPGPSPSRGEGRKTDGARGRRDRRVSSS
jgi:hypothetical protein